jgi:hypothetical protein
MDMERGALNMRVDDPSTVDIFQIKANKGCFRGSTSPTPSTHDFHAASSVRTVEMELLGQHASSVETPQGAVTWLAQGLAIEESAMHVMKDQRSLTSNATEIKKLAVSRRMDRLSSEISKFIDAETAYMRSAIEDRDDTTPNKSESEWEKRNDDPHSDLPLPFIHLPAWLP